MANQNQQQHCNATAVPAIINAFPNVPALLGINSPAGRFCLFRVPKKRHNLSQITGWNMHYGRGEMGQP